MDEKTHMSPRNCMPKQLVAEYAGHKVTLLVNNVTDTCTAAVVDK